MANRFLRPGQMDQNTYSDLLSKTFDVMWSRANDEVSVLASYFDIVDAPAGNTWKIGNVGTSLSMPIRNEDTAKRPMAQVATGFSKELTMVPYRLFCEVTDNMYRMDRYSKTAAMVSGLPMAAKAKEEYLMVDIFNSQTFSGTAGADDLALCYDDHPHENNEYGTWDNLGTGAASVGNLHALRLLAQKMTNEWGRPKPVTLQEWLIPPDLQRTFEENKVAAKDPETALNTPQVLINGMKYVISPHLTDTDAYFGFGNLMGEEKGIHGAYLMRPSVEDVNPVTDIRFAKRIKFIAVFGYSRSKNIYGSAGA